MINKDSSLRNVLELNETLSKVTQQFNILDVDKEKQLSQLCEEQGVDTAFFIEILNVFNDTSYFPKMQLGSFPIPIIIDYLKRTHKYYLNKRLLEIEQSISVTYTNDVMAKFLQEFFLKIKQELVEHIKVEESMLFPYINQLYNAFTSKDELKLPSKFEGFSVSIFEGSHTDNVEGNILEVRKYIVESNKTVVDLSPYRVLLNQLEVFEQELRVHALVEDQILIPKALVLEQMLMD